MLALVLTLHGYEIFCNQRKSRSERTRGTESAIIYDHQKHHHKGLIRDLMIEGIVTDMATVADMATGTDMALTDGVVIDRAVTDMVMVVTDKDMVVRRRGVTKISRFGGQHYSRFMVNQAKRADTRIITRVPHVTFVGNFIQERRVIGLLVLALNVERLGIWLKIVRKVVRAAGENVLIVYIGGYWVLVVASFIFSAPFLVNLIPLTLGLDDNLKRELPNDLEVTAAKEVIEYGATLPKTQLVEGVMTVMPITFVEDKAQRRLEVKARTIEKRFGGNEATKKTQRNLLNQQYENFTAPSSETLDQTFDRLQKLVS
ncbi:hypothetical protein Tco_0598249 [Tanacetum coccineum]